MLTWQTLLCVGFALARSACSASVPISRCVHKPSQAVPAIKFFIWLLLCLFLLPSISSSQRGQEAGNVVAPQAPASVAESHVGASMSSMPFHRLCKVSGMPFHGIGNHEDTSPPPCWLSILLLFFVFPQIVVRLRMLQKQPCKLVLLLMMRPGVVCFARAWQPALSEYRDSCADLFLLCSVLKALLNEISSCHSMTCRLMRRLVNIPLAQPRTLERSHCSSCKKSLPSLSGGWRSSRTSSADSNGRPSSVAPSLVQPRPRVFTSCSGDWSSCLGNCAHTSFFTFCASPSPDPCL